MPNWKHAELNQMYPELRARNNCSGICLGNCGVMHRKCGRNLGNLSYLFAVALVKAEFIMSGHIR